MKKYCFLFVFLVAALSLRAQIVGDVAVTRKVLAERGGELHMVLEISVSRKAVTRSQSWTILPELSTPDRKSVKLPTSSSTAAISSTCRSAAAVFPAPTGPSGSPI